MHGELAVRLPPLAPGQRFEDVYEVGGGWQLLNSRRLQPKVHGEWWGLLTPF